MVASCGNKNFLQPSNFRVVIDRVNYPSLEIFINSVTHPGVSIAAAENAARPRFTKIPYAGESLNFETVQFQMLIDEDMESYIEVYNWMQRMTNTQYTFPSDKYYWDRALTTEEDVKLLIMNSSNNVSKTITYYNAFPTDLGGLDLSSTNATVDPITVPLTFSYSHFIIT